MAIHDDIAAHLPDPPPPAPARRAAAIGQALQRFDGGSAAAPAADRPSRAPQSSPWWSPSRRRYAGAILSLALVVLIGVPVAQDSMREPTVAKQGESKAATDSKTMPSAPTIAADASSEPTVSSRGPNSPDIQAKAPSQADAADTVSGPAPVAFAEAAPTAPAAQAAPTPRMERAVGPSGRRPSEEGDASWDSEIVVSGSRIAAPPAASPPAEGLAAAGDDFAIVTTGARAPAPRGDWNACTVDDPGRSLSGCRHLIDPAAKGAAGRAAAHLADGLALAWKGEMDAAITAFGRAIEIAPKTSFAYLNRGLAYRRSGDPDRALADLDRAVRAAPRSARAYYNRSLILRQQGADSRAQADEKRAVSLDPRYATVVQ